MTITLTETQKEGLRFLSKEFETGIFPIKFSAPVGVGRSIIISEFLRDKRSLILTGRHEMRSQWESILHKMECVNSDVRFHLRGFPPLETYGVIVLCESIRDTATRFRFVAASTAAGAGVIEL